MNVDLFHEILRQMLFSETQTPKTNTNSAGSEILVTILVINICTNSFLRLQFRTS